MQKNRKNQKNQHNPAFYGNSIKTHLGAVKLGKYALSGC
jgi:hypothetical protein